MGKVLESPEGHDLSPPSHSMKVPDSETEELQGHTLYEKKCLLVNQAIDEMGMGKYQWYMWGLCGFGYLLDLMWAQAFGLILSPLQQEFGFGESESGNIGTSFGAGLCAGAAFWGILVDIIGRQWAFNITVAFSSIFGLALAGADSYNTFLILTAFVGFGIGGNIPIDTTITLEFIPQRDRRLLPFLSIFQPIGVVITTAIAFGFIPNYCCTPDFTQGDDMLPSCNNAAAGAPCCGKSNNFGWRYMILTIGSITMVVFILRFVVFRFRESPKFLLYKGHDEKAAKVLQQIAAFNHAHCNITLEAFEAINRDHMANEGEGPVLGAGSTQLKATWAQKIKLELSRYKILFATPAIARLTVLVWLIYVCDYWGFTVAGTFLPKIIARKNGAISVTLKQTYRSYVYIYLPGIVGVLAGVLCYDLPKVGRQITMIISSALMAVSLLVFAVVNTEASNIGLNAMEYFFQSMFNAVLYGWTPEVFAAPIRGTACGIASFWGRLFGIISPLIAAHLLPSSLTAPVEDYNRILYLAGGVTFGCVICAALLPRKMVGAQSM